MNPDVHCLALLTTWDFVVGQTFRVSKCLNEFRWTNKFLFVPGSELGDSGCVDVAATM